MFIYILNLPKLPFFKNLSLKMSSFDQVVWTATCHSETRYKLLKCL